MFLPLRNILDNRDLSINVANTKSTGRPVHQDLTTIRPDILTKIIVTTIVSWDQTIPSRHRLYGLIKGGIFEYNEVNQRQYEHTTDVGAE